MWHHVAILIVSQPCTVSRSCRTVSLQVPFSRSSNELFLSDCSLSVSIRMFRICCKRLPSDTTPMLRGLLRVVGTHVKAFFWAKKVVSQCVFDVWGDRCISVLVDAMCFLMPTEDLIVWLLHEFRRYISFLVSLMSWIWPSQAVAWLFHLGWTGWKVR